MSWRNAKRVWATCAIGWATIWYLTGLDQAGFVFVGCTGMAWFCLNMEIVNGD